MSRENVELAQAGIAAVNDAYRTGEVLPWKRHAGFATDLSWRTPAERSHACGVPGRGAGQSSIATETLRSPASKGEL